MADIGLHPEAQAEYAAALAWYRERNADAADRFEAEFDRTVASIASMPRMYPHYDDDHRFAKIRAIPTSSYMKSWTQDASQS